MTAATRSGPNLSLAITGAVLAAAIGGIAWAVIVVKSGYEVGFVAWGIGIFAGFMVAFLGKGISVLVQVIAVLSAGVGILIGKYVTFVHELRMAADKVGLDHTFGYIAGDSFRLFRENLGDVFSFHDVLWIGLAIVSAWRIAEMTGERFFRSRPLPPAPSTPTPGQ